MFLGYTTCNCYNYPQLYNNNKCSVSSANSMIRRSWSMTPHKAQHIKGSEKYTEHWLDFEDIFLLCILTTMNAVSSLATDSPVKRHKIISCESKNKISIYKSIVRVLIEMDLKLEGLAHCGNINTMCVKRTKWHDQK